MALRDQISEWPVERRLLAIGALLSLVVAMIFTIYLMFFRVQYDVLFSDLRPADAAAIVAELDQREIPYILENNETSILVPIDQTSATRIAIAGSDLPISGTVGFELFNESDMGQTEFAQKINYQRALQGELARTIMSMDEVESARVHLTIPERAIFRGKKSVPKAAVTIHARVGKILDQDSVYGMQKLIASSVNDLQLADVSILNETGRVISQASGTDEYLTPELAEKEAVEQYYRARIANALEEAAPGQKIQVEVRATSIAPKAYVDANIDNDSENEAPLVNTERNFRLFIRLIIRTNLPDDETSRIRAAAEQVITFNRGIGDRIIFSRATRTTHNSSNPAKSGGDWMTNSAADSKNRGAKDMSAVTVGNSKQSYYVYALLMLAIATVFAFLFYLSRRKGRLSDDEQSSFASRLNAELSAVEQP